MAAPSNDPEPARGPRPRVWVHLDHRSRTSVGYVKVWDLFVRLFHWGLVLSFFAAYFTTTGPRWRHEYSGTLALILVLSRVIWGFVGEGYALFSSFVPGPGQLMHYAVAMLRGREPYSIGHNPAAAVMIVFLLLMVGAIGATGWMMTTDRWWGNETVERTHIWLVNLTMGAVAVHACAAVYESFKHRENLIWAMVTGLKREPVSWQWGRRRRTTAATTSPPPTSRPARVRPPSPGWPTPPPA